jgi:hypothetical protein
MKNTHLKWALTLAMFAAGSAWAQTNFADFRVKALNQDGKKISGVRVVMTQNDIEVASDTYRFRR